MQDNHSNVVLQQAVLAHLKQGNTITNKDAVVRFDCYRLSDVIHRLRKKGHEIDTELVPNQRNHQKHAVYRLMNINQSVV